MKILVTGTYISHRLKCHRAIFALPFSLLQTLLPITWIHPKTVVIKERLIWDIGIWPVLPADNEGKRSENKTGANIPLHKVCYKLAIEE